MLKVIIIDDNYEFVESIFNLLVTKRLENVKIIKIFSDGKKALDCILNEDIDVILLDLNLPKLNGIELIQQVQQAQKRVNIITMTADSQYMNALLESKLKVYKKFIKPFNVEKLICLLEELEKTSNNNMRDNIIDLLNNFCFNKNNIGYLYLIECIELCLNNKYEIMPSSKIVYKQIAKMHNYNNHLRIGWNIDKAIKSMNELTDHNIKDNFFNHNTMPSTKYFINYMLSILNNKYHYNL